jgi:predicted nucleotidyltransferase
MKRLTTQIKRNWFTTSKIFTDVKSKGSYNFRSLRRDGMKIEQLIKQKREEILHIAARYGGRNVRVFGSVARGEADERSDIDFLVDMEAGRSLLDLGGLLMDLQEALGCNVDVVTERGLKPRIRERVLKEAIEL